MADDPAGERCGPGQGRPALRDAGFQGDHRIRGRSDAIFADLMAIASETPETRQEMGYRTFQCAHETQTGVVGAFARVTIDGFTFLTTHSQLSLLTHGRNYRSSPKHKQIQNLIAAAPLEFRRGDWQAGFAMLCSRDESTRYEEHRREALRHPSHHHIRPLPNISSGRWLPLHRAGPVSPPRNGSCHAPSVSSRRAHGDALLNAPSPVLRSDLLRVLPNHHRGTRSPERRLARSISTIFCFPWTFSHYDQKRCFEGIAARRNSMKPVVLGIDVGGTHMRLALVDEHGTVRHQTRLKTLITQGAEATCLRLIVACSDLMTLAGQHGYRVEAAGLAVAGKIDPIRGTVVFSPQSPRN